MTSLSKPPSGEPWYPETKVAVFSPRRASWRCWSSSTRTSAWMPERKIVPCSRTYLSRRVVSGRLSLTGAPGCAAAAPTPSLISVPATWSPLLTEMGQETLPTLRVGRKQELREWTNERASVLGLPRALELAEVLAHHDLDLGKVARPDRRHRAFVDADRPFGHQRGMHRHVAGDLQLAEECAHERLDGRVAAGAGEREMELHVELQEAVLVGRRVAGLQDLGHRVDRALQRGEVVVGRPHRGELGDARLEQAARLEHQGDLADAHRGALAHELDRDDVGRDEHAAPRTAAHGEQSRLAEHLDGLAQRRPADLHLRGQRALAGQLVAHAQLAPTDLLGDLFRGLLEGATGTDGLEHAHGS